MGLECFGLGCRSERLEERGQLAFHDAIKGVEHQVDAVIDVAALWEVVGADAVEAVA